MKFWKRSGSSGSTASAVKRRGSTSSTSISSSLNNCNSTLSRKPPSISKLSTNASSPSIPSRKQRMRLLKCIIHHADEVQNKYLVPKQLLDPNAPKPSKSVMSIDNMSKILIPTDTATAEINDKCYQRWHTLLQEGLVPISVHALNLLQKSEVVGNGDIISDEEETYLSTMEGMDEEIQVMAILARAAALNYVPADSEGGACERNNTAGNSDGMEEINAMMKCTAMLLFHIVLKSSSPGSSDGSAEEKDSSAEATRTVAGYDGRVRHVMKLACVDILTRAIMEGVESFDKSNASVATDENEEPSGLYDMDEYSLWNIENIRTFLDQTDLGKDAVFGTIFDSSSGANSEKRAQLMSGNGDDKQQERLRSSRTEADEHSMISGGILSRQSQSEADEEGSARGEMPPNSVESIGSFDSSGSSSSLEIQLVEIKKAEPQPMQINAGTCNGDNISNLDSEQVDGEQLEPGKKQDDDSNTADGNQSEETEVDDEREQYAMSNDEEGQGDILQEIRARRLFNAKFLATRKFELIERLVAVDIVRYLMAEEREMKLREKELKEKKRNANKIPSFLKKSNGNDSISNTDGTANAGDPNGEEVVKISAEQGEITKSQYFTAARVSSIKRGAKIAGAGLALGTVFAITGGLAAPALAAGIGGIASLTGAGTASSAAILAVLATFKAGAALFGVGGGGLAAYKMKKRTAGLSDFQIRRENIEQYMYVGASDEWMRKGVAAMMPQLHTTVAVSGWLRSNDIADFQLAWGIQPTCKYEKADDEKRRIRQMKRFYSVYNPPLVHLCSAFMETLQRRLKKDFSWDRIWSQLEQKYGANPDHMIPIDSPHDNEVFLSYEEKEMIDGVLNNAKLTNLRSRGLGASDEVDFNDNDEIAEFLANVTPKKRSRKSMDAANDAELLDLDAVEDELVAAMGSDLVLGEDNDYHIHSVGEEDKIDDQSDEKKTDESESSQLDVSANKSTDINDSSDTADNIPTLQERMALQREQQVSFLQDKGLITDESNLQEGAGSPKMAGSDSIHRGNAQDPPAKTTENDSDSDQPQDNFDEERCPVVWDWTRLYGTADIHTVTWETKFLSSLCHIVENMALEVSSQATKVALQYSVIGAIISAIAIPSALVTASKLIDDPYQIVVIRADEAGKELAKCLLQSDERRPVTLVGFSFGARVIYSCLRELARQQDLWEENRASKSNVTKECQKSSKKNGKDEPEFKYDREPASLVADVVFIGLPRAIDKKVLTSCRRVTGGRLVNCYAENDWLLSLMFVARGGTPCGVKPIKDVPGIENYDVTHLVKNHQSLPNSIPSILQTIRFLEP